MDPCAGFLPYLLQIALRFLRLLLGDKAKSWNAIRVQGGRLALNLNLLPEAQGTDYWWSRHWRAGELEAQQVRATRNGFRPWRKTFWGSFSRTDRLKFSTRCLIRLLSGPLGPGN